MRMYIVFTALVFILSLTQVNSQKLDKIRWSESGEVTSFIEDKGDGFKSKKNIPLITFNLNNKNVSLEQAKWESESWTLNQLTIKLEEISFDPGWKGKITFQNNSQDTIVIDNVVFFGESPDRHHITGYGDHWLSRTRLFRPNQSSVPVILPDNAWELGYSDVPLDNSEISVCGLARRISWENARRRRFETYLYPQGKVTYEVYADFYKGQWQDGLRLMFQKRYLYDLESFDNTMYQREDLKWIRNKYIIHLMMAWDHQFYDSENSRFTLPDFLKRGKEWYGGDDVIGIWPTWPTLGMDQRNQWDLFRDLPGGLAKLKELVESTRDSGTKFFLSYNPWDESTRYEDHLEGMTELIRETDADGVVLDTRGNSSKALQQAADDVKPGVVMYSEGMAIPKDMPGIVAGRVHNALYYPPMLNLNKFIKPDFAIFRVAELTHERIRREYSLCLFNGYGVEINMFRPGQPDWIEDDYRYLGQIARVLRENSNNFLNKEYTPLVKSLKDSVYINYWPSNVKSIYTIFSLVPEGLDEPVLEIEPITNAHIVDLWNHEEINPGLVGGKWQIPVTIDAFHKSWLGTNNEGAVGTIAVFQNHVKVKFLGNELHIEAKSGNQIKIWAGKPGYDKTPLKLEAGIRTISLMEHFGRFEGKLIVQLFNGGELIDEKVVNVRPGIPRIISKVNPTITAKKVPKGMVKIPGGEYRFLPLPRLDEFIYYPPVDSTTIHSINSFYMDKYPVTNKEYKEFLDTSGYHPIDDHNFLAHWDNGEIPVGQGNFPVVNISYEDALTYADWAGKRLPTEMEWQYAAQGGDHRIWPWGNKPDSTLTNQGDGISYSVGKYPQSSNPYGLEDLTGNVWQLTNDVYESGSYKFVILKGGSYYKPASSWWYVQGGPKQLNHRQILLNVSFGFDRNGTVGFRCLKDAE